MSAKAIEWLDSHWMWEIAAGGVRVHAPSGDTAFLTFEEVERAAA